MTALFQGQGVRLSFAVAKEGLGSPQVTVVVLHLWVGVVDSEEHALVVVMFVGMVRMRVIVEAHLHVSSLESGWSL